MNKINLLLLFLFFQFGIFAQDFTGTWYGKLDTGMGKLGLVLHIKQLKKNKFQGTMDSPDQKSYGLEISTVKVKKEALFLQLENIGAEYSGVLKDGIITGKFKQMGMNLDLVLSRDSSVLAPPNRPQEPQKPYPYLSKEVTFKNTVDNVSLAGTLTYPKEGTNFKAVILVSGSGPQDRNEELMKHKPFWVLSDYLTRNGIAVLRYDDRGTGESKGNFATSTIYNFKEDALAAITYLKTLDFIDHNQIGIIGHSEGGMIAQMIASEGKVDFAVLLASPGIPLKELMLHQAEDVLLSQNESKESIDSTINLLNKLYSKALEGNCNSGCYTEIIKQEIGLEKFQKELLTYMTMIQQLDSKWFKEFLAFQPEKYLSKIKVPVLAMNGDKDIQVRGKVNLDAIADEMADGGNYRCTKVLFPGMNHLFQMCDKCTIPEYYDLETTIEIGVLEVIENWINNFKK